MTKRLTELGYSYTHNGVTYGGAGNPPINLVQHPAHVNDVPELAARILVLGSAEGRFRAGHSLGSHIHEDVADPEQVREEYIGARGVINGGRDRAEDIAGYAQGFEAVLAPLWPSVVPKPRSNHR